MPLYDYRCTACGQEIEVMHGINDHGPEACQQCGGAMRKALSAPTIHFKGSGWAKKDAAAASAQKPRAKTDTSGDKDSKAADDKASPSDSAKTDAGTGSSQSSEAKGKATTAGSKAD